MTAPESIAPDSQKIAMTAPVSVTRDEGYELEFRMPEQFTTKIQPQPVNEQVKIVQHDAQSMAVVSFSGVIQ